MQGRKERKGNAVMSEFVRGQGVWVGLKKGSVQPGFLSDKITRRPTHRLVQSNAEPTPPRMARGDVALDRGSWANSRLGRWSDPALILVWSQNAPVQTWKRIESAAAVTLPFCCHDQHRSHIMLSMTPWYRKIDG
jgi:hypothetical protein